MDAKVKAMFASEKMDFKALAEAFPGAAEYFVAGKPGKINRYANGVMSVVIDQGKAQNSTFGYLPVGDFVFNTGANQETMRFLHGELAWGHGGGHLVKPGQYEVLVIPPGQDLHLHVKRAALYVCDYLRK